MTTKYNPNNKLIEQIKDKFGSIQRFIELSGLPERLVRVNLYRDTPGARQAQQTIAERLKSTPKPAPYRISDQERERIRLAIARDYHNVAGFTARHPQFSDSYMSYLIGGAIKCRKGRAAEVMDILEL